MHDTAKPEPMIGPAYSTQASVAEIQRAVKPAGYRVWEIIFDNEWSVFVVAKSINDARYAGQRIAAMCHIHVLTARTTDRLPVDA